MRFLFIIVSFVSCNLISAQVKIDVIEYFPDGSKAFYRNYIDEHHYIDSSWYENGNIKIVQTFKNGMPHGKCTRWLKTGILLFIKNYFYGVLNGDFFLYHSNGTLRKHSLFENDIEIEVIQQLDANGNKSIE